MHGDAYWLIIALVAGVFFAVHCSAHLAGMVSGNVRREIQVFARLCETLLSSALDDTAPMNIQECAVIRYYAWSLMARCDVFLAGNEGQRPDDHTRADGSRDRRGLKPT